MIQLNIFDVTASKHKGNARSKEARARSNITGRRKQVYEFIVSCGDKGATGHEISQALGIPLHAISGRLTELKILRMVAAVGERNGADVLRAIGRNWVDDTEGL